MILVTVGTDGPFNRMVSVIDRWAQSRGRSDVFAQIGKTDWTPTSIEHSPFLDPAEFKQRLAEASLVVSHAGMGTILSALRYQKPILVFPRRASLGEQRNEHQLATAKRLLAMGKVDVAFDEQELEAALDQSDCIKAKEAIGPHASDELLQAIRDFVGKA